MEEAIPFRPSQLEQRHLFEETKKSIEEYLTNKTLEWGSGQDFSFYISIPEQVMDIVNLYQENGFDCEYNPKTKMFLFKGKQEADINLRHKWKNGRVQTACEMYITFTEWTKWKNDMIHKINAELDKKRRDWYNGDSISINWNDNVKHIYPIKNAVLESFQKAGFITSGSEHWICIIYGKKQIPL